MANKTIPLEDKQLVTQRLAEGMSTRQAIQGTQIASNQTAARLAKAQSHVITQQRQNYLAWIEYFSVEGQRGRAAMLADMVWAKKYIKKPLPKYYYQLSGRLEYEDTLFEVPDWDIRLKAIKYIDQLAGMTPMDGSQLTVVQQVNS